MGVVSDVHHVFPLNDVVEHDTSGGDCICDPRIEEGGLIVIHHSLDGREQREHRE